MFGLNGGFISQCQKTCSSVAVEPSSKDGPSLFFMGIGLILLTCERVISDGNHQLIVWLSCLEMQPILSNGMR